MSLSPRAIIHITTTGKNFSPINYSRRMYAVIRRYTSDVIEGNKNECYADLTGLRTFFKMSYKELAAKIIQDLQDEMGMQFVVQAGTVNAYTHAINLSKKTRSISTYKELNRLFAGRYFTSSSIKGIKTTVGAHKKKFVIPFLGKVR